MGGRVWEVQKELEELQQRSLSGPQVRPQFIHHCLHADFYVFRYLCMYLMCSGNNRPI